MANTLPENVDIDTLGYEEISSNTYIANEGQIAGTDGGLEAMRQAIELILTTPRYGYQIYSSNYGIELDDLIGEEPDYIRSVLPERVKDAFSVDDRILNAQNFIFDFTGDKALITFDVITVFGTVNTGVSI